MNKCDFCENEKYIERLNFKGILENYCIQCFKNKFGRA